MNRRLDDKYDPPTREQLQGDVEGVAHYEVAEKVANILLLAGELVR